MAKRQHKRKKKKQQSTILAKGILAIFLVVLALIIFLSFFNSAGTLGEILNNWILAFLFGSIRYTVPFILVIFAWFVIKGGDYDHKPTHTIGTVLFFLALSGLMHIKFDVDDMWYQALEGYGGGVFGMFAWPVKTYLGEIAGIISLVGLTLISILLIFNTAMDSIVDFFKNISEQISGIFSREEEEEYDEEEEEYEEEEETAPKFSKKPVAARDEELYEEDEEDDAFASSSSVEDDEDEEEYEEERTNVGNTKVLKRTNKKVELDIPEYQKNVIIKKLPSLSLLKDKKGKPTSGDIKENERVIKETLAEFNIPVEMKGVRVGPTVTQFALKPAKGVKLSRLTALHNDLAMSLAAHPLRIEAPIPGKSLVGIEIPNEKTAMVTLKELFNSDAFKRREHDMMVALGKDVAGKVWFTDLPRMPHLLVAGATGSGKTVCVNTLILSLLYQNTAETLRMIMVDPKRVELTLYNGIPHLLTPVITNTQKTVNALKWSINEMERRFEVLQKAGSRDITSFNNKNPDKKLPHIVFVIDELADLMAQAANEIESGIIRLAQMARAVGIHLIVATQRPSVDVITGLMKANIPGRIAFSVASITDSRTILDSVGAEKLIGRGDMLLSTAALGKPVRIQGAYVGEDELKRVVDYLKGDEEPVYDESIVEKGGGSGTESMFGGPTDNRDALFIEARDIVISAKKASASFLQRKLRVGYARAARILDELEEAGIIGPSNGSKAREILLTEDEANQATNNTMDAGAELNVYKEEPEEIETNEEDIDDDVELLPGVEEPEEINEEDDELEDYEEDDDDEEIDFDENSDEFDNGWEEGDDELEDEE